MLFIFLVVMGDKGLTKKQFWLQITPHCINVLLGASFIFMSLDSGDIRSLNVFRLILGGVFIVISVICIVTLIIQRRRHLIVDAEKDMQVDESIKSGLLFLIFLAGAVLLIVGLILLFTHMAK